MTVANSDRRPVDPPPVVELRIKEGTSFEEGKEITFDYNASFFLYASLEQNRKIAPGRMQGQPNPPILTGVPASGMAYLDRPSAAGYFIFPDLSVRHEGQYRLSFSLFETTKEENDFDLEPSDNNLPTGVDWRMEIKTAPFDVFSAKKFPGLMESTPLSKEVADQGCRVRIRREVRMRKREGKSNRHERREEDFSRHRTVTPASEDPNSAAARARSMSNSSEQRVPYPADAPRRPSGVEAYPPPPPQPSFESASRGHLSFGDPSAPQYATPRHYGHQAMPPVSPGGPYKSTPSTPYIKPEAQLYPYPPTRSIPPQPCPSPALNHECHERRQSGAYIPPSPSVYSSDGHIRRDSQQPSYPSTPISANPSARAQTPVQNKLAPLRMDGILNPIEPETEPPTIPAPVQTGGKRKHNLVFTQSTRPLHNGQRQQDSHYGGARGRESSPIDSHYFRADGTLHQARFNEFSQ